MKSNYQINVVGLGFVGLTTALGLAHKGHYVFCIDNKKEIIKKLKNKKISFYEKNLQKILKMYLNKKVFFSNNFNLKKKKQIIFICVGTPYKKNSYDTKYIYQVIKKIKKYKNKEIIIVIKSTVLPGTCSNIYKKLLNNKNIKLCFNPEFLREGYAWEDFIKPDKIVVGSNDQKASNAVLNIYKNFLGKKVITNFEEAEYIKIVANNFLSNVISFANFCSLVIMKSENVNLKKIFETIKIDKRWHGNPANISTYFHPGAGFGGYCLPKDTKAFGSFSKKKLGFQNIILPETTYKINELIKNHYVKIILRRSEGFKKIILLGLSFKPNSDDLRESISVKIFQTLSKKTRKKIELLDPYVKSYNGKKINNSKAKYKKDYFYVLCTAHRKYISFLRKINKKNFLDTRNII